MLAIAEKLLSIEEYLMSERQASFKSEYFDGEMYAMAGASREHNLIVTNIIRMLGNQLLESPCNVYPSDMRVKIAEIGKYTYPDVTIACDEEIFDDDYKDTLLNPLLIIEVLSDSTESYDRGKKFKHYQRIKSFSEYILIEQTPYRVEQYVRQDNRTWLYSEFHEAADIVQLKIIKCTLALKDIYAKI
ncbi:protein of unknown function DUF820 [Beggiatoa sp. PS]|nr:protein of unknown function DUF820 [Beggiatoa sp. PS]